jgi:hypothetical protein
MFHDSNRHLCLKTMNLVLKLGFFVLVLDQDPNNASSFDSDLERGWDAEWNACCNNGKMEDGNY